jgi:hypothetical protein
LSVDVPDVRAADNRDIDARGTEHLDQLAHRTRVRAPIGNGSAVPVEDDRVESARYRVDAQGLERRFTTWVVAPG